MSGIGRPPDERLMRHAENQHREIQHMLSEHAQKRLVDLSIGFDDGEKDEGELSSYLKTALFDTYRCNATHLTLFEDGYNRVASTTRKDLLPYHLNKAVLIDEDDEHYILINPEMADIAALTLKIDINTIQSIELFPGSVLAAVPSTAEKGQQALAMLGSAGCLPNRETQLQIYQAQLGNDSEAIADRYNELVERAFDVRYEISDITERHKIGLRSSLTGLKHHTSEKLKAFASALSSSPENHARVMYINLINKLLLHTDLSTFAKPIKNQAKLSLIRMLELLKEMEVSSFSQFALLKDACFDEILFLQGLQQVNASPDKLIAAKAHALDTLHHFVAESTGTTPVAATYTTSGMQSLTQAIAAACEAMHESATPGDGVGVYMQQRTYYESKLWIGLLAGREYSETSEAIKFSHHGTSVSETDGIQDVYIGSFENNAAVTERGNAFFDVNKWVEHQFELRAESEETKHRPLVVVLDNTMSHFDDVYVEWLLTEFNEQIESGQLAVVVASSLNKYFNVGTDKTPLGTSALFAKKGAFPSLETLYGEASEEISIAGFSPLGPTISLATSLIEHARPELAEYPTTLREQGAHLHKHVLSESNYDEGACIQFGDPKSHASYTDSPSTEKALGNCWNFIDIKIHETNTVIDADDLTHYLTRMLFLCDIPDRSGFGYSQSTFAHLPLHVLRISIGVEPLDELMDKFKIIDRFISRVNLIIKELDPIAKNIFDEEHDGETKAETNDGVDINRLIENEYHKALKDIYHLQTHAVENDDSETATPPPSSATITPGTGGSTVFFPSDEAGARAGAGDEPPAPEGK